MTKARELADLGSVTTRLDEVGNTDGALSSRNLIINGAMQVAQRGTSFGYVNGYKLDRWVFDSYGGGSNNCVQDADVPDAKFRNSVKITATADMSDYYFYQKVEGYKHLSGQTVTFSFYAKASQAITGMQIHWEAASTSGGAEQFMTDVETYNLTTSWQRFTFTLTLPAFTTAETTSARFGIFNALRQTYTSPQKGTNIPNGASVWYTGLQLEYGDTATPFEHRSYGDELARCQRYFYKYPDTGDYSHPLDHSSGFRSQFAAFPVIMRANPTLSNVSGSGNYSPANPDLSGGVVHGAYFQWNSVASSSFNRVDSGFTADAEL